VVPRNPPLVNSGLCADAGRILWGRHVRVRRCPHRQGAS